MSNNSIIKDLVFPISLLLDTPNVRSQFNQLASSNNLRGFNLYKVLEEGMKANYMQCLSSSDVVINNTLYPAGTPITDLIGSSVSESSVWLNENGTSATSASTNIKYDRGNVTIGTLSVNFDLFQVIPTTTTLDTLLVNSSSASLCRLSHVFDSPTAIPVSTFKTIILNRQVFNSNSSNTVDVSGLGIIGMQSVISWSSPTPVRQMNSIFSILSYKGADVNNAGASVLYNHAGQVTLLSVTDKTQTVNTVGGKYISFQNSGATNTIQNVSTVKNIEAWLLTNLTSSNVVNITNVEQFTNSGQGFGNTGVGSSLNITNLYGLRLASPSTYLNTNITNNYGISQEWSSAKNYFAGNVGIGTTDTGNYKLNVDGSLRAYSITLGRYMFSESGGILLGEDGGGFYLNSGTAVNSTNPMYIGSRNSKIKFYSNDLFGMILDSNGNIGIKTQIPTSALHVVGQARLESYTTVTYDSTTPTKSLGINSFGEVVSVVNQNISNYALVTQANHGFTTVTPLKFNSSTGLYEEASAIDTGTLARTVFIKSYNANTMIVSSNCIATIPDHTLDIGMSYYTSPTGVGMEREGILQPLDIKQHVLYVIDANTLQINLQQQYY